MPATVASGERSFSKLIKNILTINNFTRENLAMLSIENGIVKIIEA